ncbi:glycosyltransferase family 2 protein [Bacteroides hominis]|uniref:glycosyltransferase family 2 protein n=1 Tax=Bacteroides hominis TaxID=2763023 RepID=UPI0039C364DA
MDISVVILTYNEELHIGRCLDNVSLFAKDIFIIDSFSTDRTLQIVKEYPNVIVLQNKWENNYAKQFNWGLEHAPIKTEWVLRLDADEYLLPELIEELNERLDTLDDDITGILFNRRHYFMDKWMKRGIYPVKLLRLFRLSKGICEQRLMDEHIQLLEGKAIEFKYDFVDHNLNDLSWFCHKHVNYAIREAVDLLDIEYGLTGLDLRSVKSGISKQALIKRNIKYKYAKQPLFWRSFFYFCYRYFYRGACLDGKVGFIWTFMQGWWYRTLVDAKIFEIKTLCQDNPEMMKKYLLEHYNIKL